MQIKFKIKKKRSRFHILKMRKKNMYQKNHLKKICKLVKTVTLPKKKVLKLNTKKSLLHKFKTTAKFVVIIKTKNLKRKIKPKKIQVKYKNYYSKRRNVKK